MHVDEPHVTPLPWWFPLLLLLGLLFIWPLMVELVGRPMPSNSMGWLQDKRVSSWHFAYGEALNSQTIRNSAWRREGGTPFLLDTPWAEAFPMRILVLSCLWTILGLAAARNPRGVPIPPWLTWSTWSVALFPWVYLMLSAGAGRGYSELIAARFDMLPVGDPEPTAYTVPINSPPTETLIALGALVAILLVLLMIELRSTGRFPTLAQLLRLDLEPRDPGRVLHGLPRMQRDPAVFLAPSAQPSDAVSSSAQAVD